MKKWMGLLLVVGILLFVGSFIIAIQDSTSYAYEGKEIFQTAQEYRFFKEVVGSPKVDIQEILVLSSEPPIVVDYLVWAPKGLDFPFGERGFFPTSVLFAFLVAFGIVATVIGGIVLTSLILDREREG